MGGGLVVNTMSASSSSDDDLPDLVQVAGTVPLLVEDEQVDDDEPAAIATSGFGDTVDNGVQLLKAGMPIIDENGRE